MEQQPKINLIYIASIGRSGSTLLESMLGAHSQIATCGELHIWPHEIAQGGVRPCACGKSSVDCPFWAEMRQRVDPLLQPQPQIHFFRERHNAGKTLRKERLQEFVRRESSPETVEMIQTYGRNNDEVFRSFLNLIQIPPGQNIQWIVDSSKDPYRLLWLVRSNLFNIKVLHIIKNPHAFIYSVTKNVQKNIFSYLYTAVKQSAKWSIENYLISQIAHHHLTASNYLLVNYERLAAHPAETLKEICQMIGCDFEEQAIHNFRQGGVHTIAGNPMRYEKRGIALDERWKNSLSTPKKTVTESVTWMNRANYGYH